jgi:23S rRNA (cytidine1920-2'-O)/16S rRNA (cytidine1409-2'-O)-methyltransferase
MPYREGLTRWSAIVVAKNTQRLDVMLTERGLAASRARAQALVMAGKVTVDGTVVTKAGAPVADGARLEIAEPDHPWVSRGALKLEAALDACGIDPAGLDCLDCGASTGGFSQLLLARGASRVVALDVGRGQLDWKLRSDPRVTVMEGVNARYLVPGDLPFSIALATVDVSFISLRLIVPALQPLILPRGWLICLVKPQFEAGRDQVGKGGIVRDDVVRRRVIDGTVAALAAGGLDLLAVIPSPIEGQKGNREELAVFQTPGPMAEDGDGVAGSSDCIRQKKE